MFNIWLEMHITVSMFWVIYKLQIMLIYYISYIGFGKNLLIDITKSFLGPPQNTKLSTAWKMMKYRLSLIHKVTIKNVLILSCFHCVKYHQIRDFSNPYFPVLLPNTGKYGYYSLHIQEKTDYQKAVFGDISRSGVFWDIS